MRNIQFWILGSGIDNLNTACEDGTTVTLVDWMSASYSVKIREITVTDSLWDIKRPGYGYTVLRCAAKLQEV